MTEERKKIIALAVIDFIYVCLIIGMVALTRYDIAILILTIKTTIGSK